MEKVSKLENKAEKPLQSDPGDEQPKVVKPTKPGTPKGTKEWPKGNPGFGRSLEN